MIRKIGSIFLFLIVLSSCKHDRLSFVSREKLLTRTTWQIKSFIDNSTNQEISVNPYTYDFYSDGNLIVTSATNDKYLSTWSFYEDDEFLIIGDNLYKIIFLSRKILTLEYGSSKLYYEAI